MILGFKKNFPNGEPTYFKELITKRYNPHVNIDELIPVGMDAKIHSIRTGKRWRAGMSIQMAYGVRTKYYEQFNKDYPELQDCKKVQDVFMTYNGYELEVTVGNSKYMMPNEIDILIKNDGLNRQQFIDWFFPKGVDEFSGQIIHWTDYKY